MATNARGWGVTRGERPPHPATVAQPKVAFGTGAARPPHPATLAPHGARIAHPSIQRASSAPAKHFLVDDDATPGPGQVRRGPFLSALRAKVSSVAGQVLAEVGQEARDCPYIPYWFSYYGEKDAQHIEHAIDRYAPETREAQTWEEYADRVAARVRRGFEQNVANGSLTGVPDDVPKDLERRSPEARVTAQMKPRPRVIQRCGDDPDPNERRVSGGTFRVVTFRVNDLNRVAQMVGPDMVLTFTPRNTRETVGLIQTVEIVETKNGLAAHAYADGGLHQRVAANGVAIDRHQDNNPVYGTDTGMNGVHLTDDPGGEGAIATREHPVARLEDSPCREYNGKTNIVMRFEVAAVVIAGTRAGTYLGSISWGWSWASNTDTVTLDAVQVVSMNGTSVGFQAAAVAWNNARLRDYPNNLVPVP